MSALYTNVMCLIEVFRYTDEIVTYSKDVEIKA